MDRMVNFMLYIFCLNYIYINLVKEELTGIIQILTQAEETCPPNRYKFTTKNKHTQSEPDIIK